jgi:hypothetical protein
MRNPFWIVMALLGAIGLAACSNPRAWYRVDDYPGFTGRPITQFGVDIEKPDHGAPPRMLKYDAMLNVGCSYCHVEADAVTGDLTAEGTLSRLMIDMADRFKVDCNHCHISATKLTQAGRYAERDMHIPARRWACATCHDFGFRVTKRG